MKIFLASVALIFTMSHAYAKDRDAVTFTSANTIKEVLRVTRACDEFGMYKGILYISGTWNSNTIHFLESPDEGASKFPMKDLTRVAVTSTSDDSIPIELGLPSGNNIGTIVYVSADGSSTDPSLSIFVQDCE